jgi:ubiquinone biosynthesis protein UbiJ
LNALETLLRPVTRLVNREISSHTAARELCEELAGRVVAVRVRDTGLAMYFFIEPDGIRLSGERAGEADVVISGSLITLATLGGRSGEAAVRDGLLDISGDAEVARSFQRLLHYGKPDVEEQLSNVIGDAAAHNIGRLARGVVDWGRRARSTFRQNLGEYLQEESRAVPNRHETDAFRRDVETLRDDVARLEARLERLEKRPGTTADETRGT